MRTARFITAGLVLLLGPSLVVLAEASWPDCNDDPPSSDPCTGESPYCETLGWQITADFCYLPGNQLQCCRVVHYLNDCGSVYEPPQPECAISDSGWHSEELYQSKSCCWNYTYTVKFCREYESCAPDP